jgi:hypothetical protein
MNVEVPFTLFSVHWILFLVPEIHKISCHIHLTSSLSCEGTNQRMLDIGGVWGGAHIHRVLSAMLTRGLECGDLPSERTGCGTVQASLLEWERGHWRRRL